MVMMTGSLAVRGTVIWLTPQQGGRVSGPPEPTFEEVFDVVKGR